MGRLQIRDTWIEDLRDKCASKFLRRNIYGLGGFGNSHSVGLKGNEITGMVIIRLVLEYDLAVRQNQLFDYNGNKCNSIQD